jgi:uncharacterized membrane protein
MSKHTDWLNQESERWTDEQIITAEQATRIRRLYETPASALSWGLLVFFGLGAVIVGLGIILLFAYNWDDIPKAGKLALVFGSLMAAHAAGLWLQAKNDWRPRLGEAFSLLGTMLFGAGIWLIAQIYNIDEHYPNGFLMWALGALALAWALQSVPQAILATALLGIWGGAEVLGFAAPADASALIVALGVAPLAWRCRSPVLAAVVLAALYWLLLCNAGFWGGGAGAFANALALSALLLALVPGKQPLPALQAFSGVFRFFGYLGFVACSYLLSFHDIVHSLLRWSGEHEGGFAGPLYRWVVFALAAGAWAWRVVRAAQGHRRDVRAAEWLCPIALVYVQLMTVRAQDTDDGFIAIMFNLVCLGTATAWMVRGCRTSRLGLTVRGSGLLAIVVFARYFDLFDSLAMRGLIFLGFGGVLFAEGFFYRRIRAEAEAGGGES